MFYDPDECDLYITLLKFLAVISSGMLAGETWFISMLYPLPWAGWYGKTSYTAEGEVLCRDLRSLWPKAFRVYGTTLVATFAAFGASAIEVRERFMWLYGGLALLALLLYSKFYMFPFMANCMKEFGNLSKDRKHVESLLVRFCMCIHIRTLVAFLSFAWLAYSLYVS